MTAMSTVAPLPIAIPAIVPEDKPWPFLASLTGWVWLGDGATVELVTAVATAAVAVVLKGSAEPSDGQGSPGSSINVESLASWR
jgi:hypothetical protein